MDIESIIKDTNANELVKVFGIQTECGKERFLHDLKMPILSDVHILQKKQQAILNYRDKHKDTHTDNKEEELKICFEIVKEIEPKLRTLLSPSSLDKESVEQILFSKWKHIEILNTIPFFLTLVSMWKQYAAPILAICLPLLFFFGPYIALVYIYKTPMPFDVYLQIFFNTVGLHGKIELKEMVQICLTLFSVGQSMYQPIQQAFHIRRIETDIQEKGRAILQLRDILNILYPNDVKKNPLADLDEKDILCSFAACWDLPFRLRIAFQHIGEQEVLYRLSTCTLLCPVSWNTVETVSFKDAINPFQPLGVPFSLKLKKGKHHVILTGPNGGGKSSCMRSFLLNLFVVQKIGFFFSSSSTKSYASIDPFQWIASGLRLEDTPGTQSLFEREVQFASQCLFKKGRGFIIFDELFHSTNPPDGERSASLFLQSVWSKRNLSSIISTHVFSLAEMAPPHVQQLCVPAKHLENGDIQFDYTLQKGICKISSVDIVFKKCGFPERNKPIVEKDKE